MACTFASTAEIEQQFSLLELLSNGRKARTTTEHLRSFMKCRLNGHSLAMSSVFQ